LGRGVSSERTERDMSVVLGAVEGNAECRVPPRESERASVERQTGGCRRLTTGGRHGAGRRLDYIKTTRHWAPSAAVDAGDPVM
jgi:hypothetical protein